MELFLKSLTRFVLNSATRFCNWRFRPCRVEYRWKRELFFARALDRFCIYIEPSAPYTTTYIFQYDLICREHVVQLIQRRKSLALLRWNSDRTCPPSSACFAKVLVFACATTCVTRQWGFAPKVAPSLLLDTKRQGQYTMNKEIRKNCTQERSRDFSKIKRNWIFYTPK